MNVTRGPSGLPLQAVTSSGLRPAPAPGGNCATPGRSRYKLGFTPYRSRAFFLPTYDSAAGTYTIARGAEIGFFSAAIGDDMAPVGAPGVLATYADTMLETRNKTRANQRVLIKGISIQAQPKSQIALAKAAWADLAVFLSLNAGQDRIFLGTLADLPGASSLYGSAVDGTQVPALPGGEILDGFFSNGLPGIANYGSTGDGVLWRPESDSKGDTSLSIIVQAQRTIVLTASTVRTAIAPASASGFQGVTAFAQPAPGAVSNGAITGSVLLDLSCRLFGVVDGPRSTVI